MDKDTIKKHYDMVLSHYPNLNLEQLGGEFRRDKDKSKT